MKQTINRTRMVIANVLLFLIIFAILYTLAGMWTWFSVTASIWVIILFAASIAKRNGLMGAFLALLVMLCFSVVVTIIRETRVRIISEPFLGSLFLSLFIFSFINKVEFNEWIAIKTCEAKREEKKARKNFRKKACGKERRIALRRSVRAGQQPFRPEQNPFG